MLILLQKYYKMGEEDKGGSIVFNKRLKKVIVSGIVSVVVATSAIPAGMQMVSYAATQNAILEISKIVIDQSSPQAVGTTVVISAECKGGTGVYDYTYTVTLPNGTVETIAEGISSSFINYTLSEKGVYNFGVKVTDGVDSVSDRKEFEATSNETTTSKMKASLSMNKTKISKKDTVKFKVGVSNASGTAKSKIVVKLPNGKNVTVKKYSAKMSAKYKVKKKGTYKVTAYVKDSKKTVTVKKTFKVK